MSSKTYYEVLGIDSDATKKEIKKAYFKKVRQNSPDKKPEEFKKIRSAYEILSDETAKKEYDQRVDLPKWVSRFIQRAERFREKGDTKFAIKIYKEILEKYKRIRFVQVELGETYLENGNSQKAINMFKSLLKKNNDDVFLLKRLITSYSERGWFKKAIEVCEYMLDNELEDKDVIYEMIVNSYVENNKLREARKAVTKSLKFKDIDHANLYAFVLAAYFAEIRFNDNFSSYYYHEVSNLCYDFIDYLKDNTEEIEEYITILIHVVFMTFDLKESKDLLIPLLEYVEDKEAIELYESIKKDKLINEEIKQLELDKRISQDVTSLTVMSYIKNNFDYDEIDPLNFASYKMEIIDKYDKYLSEFSIIKKEYKRFYVHIKEFHKNIVSHQGREKEVKKLYKVAQIHGDSRFMDFLSQEEQDFYEEDDKGETFVKKENEVGRNDPCPCGSGKKYKKCCLKL